MADGSLVFCYGCVEPGHYDSPEAKLAAERASQPHTEFVGKVVTNPDANNPFLAEAGRYELVVAAGCPFASRAWATACALGLDQEAIRIVRCWPANGENGFFFSPSMEEEQAFVDKRIAGVEWEEAGPSVGPEGGGPVKNVKELYLRCNAGFNGSFAVPLLYDTKHHTIVNNSSIDISIMLATEFQAFAKNPLPPLIPATSTVEAAVALLQDVHARINIGVYKLNFEQDQAAYEAKAVQWFQHLDSFEAKLGTQRFLMGDTVSVPDFALAATLVRLPLVYAPRFRANLKAFNATNYPNLVRYLRDLVAEVPGYRRCVDYRGILTTYHFSTPINKRAGKTVPLVPLDLVI